MKQHRLVSGQDVGLCVSFAQEVYFSSRLRSIYRHIMCMDVYIDRNTNHF